MTAPAAEARPGYGYGQGYGRGYAYRGGYGRGYAYRGGYGYRRGGYAGPAIAAGIAGLAFGAIAAQSYRQAPPAYGYYAQPTYGYYGRPAYGYYGY